jgi:hypothetical protein
MSPTSDRSGEKPEGTDDVDLDEDTHPSEPHPDEPRAKGPFETSEVHGPTPERLSEVGEPRADEPRIERLAPEEENVEDRSDADDDGDGAGNG